MKSTLKVHLRRNERLFANGAVLRPDRKVTIEFLNDVTFLLESHVMQEDQAVTSLRQLYFVLQSILIDPNNAAPARAMYERSYVLLHTHFRSEVLLAGLNEADEMVRSERVFEAMKIIRRLFPIEDEIMFGETLLAAG
ncbi:MAG: flagellar biosynthesis repressor FlbT [Alphaproteobacteria bacterium]|nr:flagellar biosynthesis repressor FlbT [Alphaproteobacteria bacterium]